MTIGNEHCTGSSLFGWGNFTVMLQIKFFVSGVRLLKNDVLYWLSKCFTYVWLDGDGFIVQPFFYFFERRQFDKGYSVVRHLYSQI